jgi:hypothetical protein
MSADSKQLSPGCLLIFGLPFLLVGLGVAGWGVRSWVLYAQSASWQRLPATVLNVEFVEHAGSDGDTYSVDATYKYDYGGTTYTGHRVGIMGGSSSSYGMHRRRYEELEAARQSGKPVTALANPHNPADALLYREAETWLFIMVPFGLVFAAAGVLVIGLGVSTKLRQRKLVGIAAHDANRLWDARKDWAEGCVRASTVKDMLIYWGWGLGLSLFMSVFIIAVMKEGAPLFAKAIVGLFCLTAALMLLKAVTLTLREIVQGTPVLYLSEVPVVPGRTVLGAVRTHSPLRSERWQVRLRCFVPTTGKNTSSEDRERVARLTEQLRAAAGQQRSWASSDWRGMCAFNLDLQPAGDAKLDSAGRSMLPVSIEVPAGVPGASLDPGFAVYWVLAVKARSFPVPFSASFDLPVFYADDGEIRRTTAKAD